MHSFLTCKDVDLQGSFISCVIFVVPVTRTSSERIIVCGLLCLGGSSHVIPSRYSRSTVTKCGSVNSLTTALN